MLALGALGAGCGGGAGAGGHARSAERGTAASVAVSDDAFAGAVHDLLLADPGSRDRRARLEPAFARQMVRTTDRFKTHATDRALAAVTGGMYLLRTRELTPGMLDAAHDAIVPAAREFASRGDEGRARAMYEILARSANDGDKRDASTHLEALTAWTKDTVATGGPVQRAGALEVIAVSRWLLEPSDQALDEASTRTTAWIAAALELRNAYRSKHAVPPREEGAEAYRALQSGGATLAAIYLRNADAAGAVRAIERAQAGELVRPDLLRALEAATDKPTDAKRWVDVLHGLRPAPSPEGQEDDAIVDKELLRAAAFAVAIEAYRLDPSLPEAAGAVAAGLQEYGMGEASPAVLVEALRKHADVRTIGGALAIVMHAMAMEVDAQDAAAARRTFRAATPLLAIADRFGGKLQPSAPRVRAMMGEIELREGRVAEARDLIKTAALTEKSGATLATLARIERHDGQIPAAVGHLREALPAADVANDPALKGEILLTLSDIARQQGDATGARTPLVDALRDLAKARGAGDGEDRARVERVLSRVLDRFGAVKNADRALERAFDAAPRDKQQASATLGLIVGRALLRGDLPAARDGLRRAVAADIGDDDLVYIALWERLLEKQLKAASDGTADRVFSQILDDGRWIGRLSAFGSGRIRADELVSSAKTPAQATEALFYAALDRRTAGDLKGAEAMLRQVLQGGGVELMEVALTRDLLDGAKARVSGPLPDGVGIP